MSGSTSRSTTGRPRRAPTSSPTARSPVTVRAAACGRTRSPATRSDSSGPRIPDRTSGHHRVGTPSTVPAGIARSRSRAHSDAPDAPDGDELLAEPELVAELGRLGPAGEERVGGEVDGPSREFGGPELAAGPRRGLEHDDRGRRRAGRAPDELPCRGEPRDAAPDDRDGRRVLRMPSVPRRSGPGRGRPFVVFRRAHRAASCTTRASTPTKRGSSLSEAVRANATPAARAASAASMSRS